MAMGFGCLPGLTFKKKNLWWFKMINGDNISGTFALPHVSGQLPQLAFKEQEVQHVSETIWYPVKPEWKPIKLTLYNVRREGGFLGGSYENPVFEWIKTYYQVSENDANFMYPKNGFKRNGQLSLLSACGATLETWAFDNMYPSEVNFGDVDMKSVEVMTVDVTLRYDRAYSVSTQCRSEYEF